MAERFASVPDVVERLRTADYLADPAIAGVVYLADRLAVLELRIRGSDVDIGRRRGRHRRSHGSDSRTLDLTANHLDRGQVRQ